MNTGDETAVDNTPVHESADNIRTEHLRRQPVLARRILASGRAVTRCTRWLRVPLELAREAEQRTSTGYVDRAIQCRLSDHEGDDHYGLLTELDTYGTALWLRWHGTETALLALPDCPMTGPGPDGEGCCLFADHPEAHTWQHAPEVTSYAS